MLIYRRLAAVAGLTLARGAAAHEHHDDNIPEGEVISPDPIVCYSLRKLAYGTPYLTLAQDTTLWIHIFIQILAFGLVFPTGMVLGVNTFLPQLSVPFSHVAGLIILSLLIRSFTHAGTFPSKPSAPSSPSSAISSVTPMAAANLHRISTLHLPRYSCSCSSSRSSLAST